MTPDQQSNPPPADATIFKFPAYYRPSLIGMLIVLCGFVALGLALPWLEPGRGSLRIAALSVGVFGSVAFYVFLVLRCSRDCVAANDDGLWYLPHAGSPTFIRWSEVATVRARDLMRRLVVTDISGRKVKLEFELENSDRLREIVLRNTTDRRRQTQSASLFHAGNLQVGVPAFGALFFLYLVCLSVHQRAGQGVEFALSGFLVLTLSVSVWQPRRVRISSQSITIAYPGWQRTIAYDAIKDIALSSVVSGSLPSVMIKRREGRPLRLFMLREGSVALYDALRTAWLNARGEQDGAKQA